VTTQQARDAASAARLLARKSRPSSHYEDCYRDHIGCCLLRCAVLIEELAAERDSLQRTVDAQLRNLIEGNSHTARLTQLVRALRDVNEDLDRKLSSGGVSGAEVVGVGSLTT
jgi:hypothetical protein